MRVRLKRDSLEADIAPGAGGAIAAFRHDGRDIFRAAAGDVRDPLAMGAFPMAPYVNRIALGYVHWRGETFLLPPNFGDHPHPLHGVGWCGAWTCEHRGAHAVELDLVHEPDDAWPWRVAMTQAISLTAWGLEVALSVTNLGAPPMPASIGLHPYFPAAGAVVQLHAAAQVLTTAEGIPTRAEHTAAVDALAAGAPVGDRALDHCFTGWDGRVDIVWPDRTLRIETDPPQRFVQIYTPPSADFFCVEPQSATPNAVNREGSGVVELLRGETLAFVTRFVVG